MSIRRVLFPLILTMLLQSGITVTVNSATPDYPNKIDFQLNASGPTLLESAQIQIQTDALTCGESATRATAEDFTPGTSIHVDWTWDLRETGALPPGSTIRWQWIIEDGRGQTHEIDEQSLTLEDETHSWREVTEDSLTVLWYVGDDAFAQEILMAGEAALTQLDNNLGIRDDGPIRLYVYASSEEMQSSTLYAPSWSGGVAFPEHNAVMIGISPEELDWGKRAVAHELTHVVVGRNTFSCLDSTPIWFSEGLAMYMEGPVEPYYAGLLDQAIKSDSLLSVKELGFLFSGQSELSSLSYAESESLVTFLIDQYGQEKLLLLLDEFRTGTSEDRALETVYGLDRDGLEVAWRQHIGAEPMQADSASDQPEPTLYPTYVPIAGPPEPGESVPITPEYVTGERQSSDNPASPQLLYPVLALLVVGGTACVVFGVVVVGVGGWLIWRRRRPHD